MSKSKDKDLKTEVESGEFRGSPTISIWEIDDEGKRKPFPLISFGIKKGKALVKHIKEIEAFLK